MSHPRLGSRRYARRLLGLLVAATAVLGLVEVSSSGAARDQSVTCQGTALFCAATVPIAGGAHNRLVTVALTDTNFKVTGVWAIPASSADKFKVTHASFRQGGSEYRFTLNAEPSNPARARIVVLFTSGR